MANFQKYLSENYEETVNIANQISEEWGQCMSSFNKSSLIPLQESAEDPSEDI
jgi:hypothetical protein